MQRDQIAKRFTLLLRDLADNNSIVLTDAMTADDVEEWDSLLHVKLLIAMESEFSVRFSTTEINGPRNVGEVYDMLERKLA